MTDTELERKWHFKYHRDCLETGNLVYGYRFLRRQMHPFLSVPCVLPQSTGHVVLRRGQEEEDLLGGTDSCGHKVTYLPLGAHRTAAPSLNLKFTSALTLDLNNVTQTENPLLGQSVAVLHLTFL